MAQEYMPIKTPLAVNVPEYLPTPSPQPPAGVLADWERTKLQQEQDVLQRQLAAADAGQVGLHPAVVQQTRKRLREIAGILDADRAAREQTAGQQQAVDAALRQTLEPLRAKQRENAARLQSLAEQAVRCGRPVAGSRQFLSPDGGQVTVTLGTPEPGPEFARPVPYYAENLQPAPEKRPAEAPARQTDEMFAPTVPYWQSPTTGAAEKPARQDKRTATNIAFAVVPGGRLGG